MVQQPLNQNLSEEDFRKTVNIIDKDKSFILSHIGDYLQVDMSRIVTTPVLFYTVNFQANSGIVNITVLGKPAPNYLDGSSQFLDGKRKLSGLMLG